MAFAERYISTFESAAGWAVEVALLKNGYGGSPDDLRLGGPSPLVIRASKGESDELEPLRPKVARVKVHPKDLGVVDEVYADDTRWRLRVKTASALDFIGPLRKPPTLRMGLDKFPEAAELTANCGLGVLQDTPFRLPGEEQEVPTQKRTVVEWIAFCLRKIGTGLPLWTASTYHAHGMASSDSPLEQEYLDPAAWQDEEGDPISCFAVLEDLARAKGAFLCQDRPAGDEGAAWHFYERALFEEASFQRRRWNLSDVLADGSGEASSYDARVQAERPLQQRRSGSQALRREAHSSVQVDYKHGPANLLPNPGLHREEEAPDDLGTHDPVEGYTEQETLDFIAAYIQRGLDAPALDDLTRRELRHVRYLARVLRSIREWEKTDGVTPLPRRAGEDTAWIHMPVREGGYGDPVSAQLSSYMRQSTPTVVEKSSTGRLFITAKGRPVEGRLSGDYEELKPYPIYAYLQVKAETASGETYWLKREIENGREADPTWTQDESFVACQVTFGREEEIEVTSPLLPGDARITFLFREAIDAEAARLEEEGFERTKSRSSEVVHTPVNYWRWTTGKVVPIFGGEASSATNPEATIYIAAGSGASGAGEEKDLSVRTGTGPSGGHDGASHSRLVIYDPEADEEYQTAGSSLLDDWKRGAYADEEAPSGLAAGQLLAKEVLVQMRSERGEIEATYDAREVRPGLTRALVEEREGGATAPHLPVRVERDFRRAERSVNAVEVWREPGDVVYRNEPDSDGSASESGGSVGGGGGARRTRRVSELEEGLTTLSGYLSKHNPLAKLDAEVPAGDTQALPVGLPEGLVEAGDDLVVVDAATGRPARMQASAAPGAEQLEVEARGGGTLTLDEPLVSGSGLYFGHRELLQVLRGKVDSVFGREGSVTAEKGDYRAGFVTTPNSSLGDDVAAALDALAAGKADADHGHDRLRLVSGSASLSSKDHGLQIGSSGSRNLIFDKDEIQARDNGGVNDLALNEQGGPVTVNGNPVWQKDAGVSASQIGNDSDDVGGSNTAEALDTLASEKASAEQNYTVVNVRAYGAEGDGRADDTEPITRAIEDAAERGHAVFFPSGDYFVTAQLPFYANMGWVGDGAAYQQTFFISILEIEDLGGTMRLTLDDPENRVNYRLMDGEPLKTKGCRHETNNTLSAVDSVDPSASTVTLNHSDAYSTTSPGEDAEARVAYPMGGSIIRMQNLADGSVHTGDRFIDERGLRNVVMKDLGFVGPGINSIYGGGMRFRRTENNRAITGFEFRNVSLEHVAMDGIRFDQLIHSTLSHLLIKRCVGDGLLFKGAHGIGGTTTSVHIEAPYIQNVRRGIASYISAYCTVTNPVIEATSLAYYFERAIGLTFNAPASETVKFDESGAGGGETMRLIDCYGTVINSPTIYYNTQPSQWSKCAILAADPKRRVESPFGQIAGGHLHWSVGPKIPAIATRWDGPTDTGRVYVDVSEDYGYVPPDGNVSSSWIGKSYWHDGILIQGLGFARDERFNDRYRVSSIEKTTYTSSGAVERPRPPGPYDDSGQGFEFGSTWKDTTLPSREGRWFCIDASPGAARWTDAEAVFEIEFEGRDYNPLDKKPVPKDQPAYLIRAGRNYGTDLATDVVYRVLETATSASGELIAWLDIQEWLPVRYLAQINYDPWTGYSTRAYTIQDQALYTHSDGVTYLKTTYVVPSAITDGHNWKSGLLDPEDAAGHPVRATFDALGIEHVVEATYIEEDEGDTALRTYVPVEEFFREGEILHIRGTMLSEMEGEWAIRSAVFDTSNVAGLPCVKVTAQDSAGVTAGGSVLREEITRSVDYGVYNHPRTTAPVSTGMSVTGFDALFMYDPTGAVKMEGGRSFEATFAEGELTTTVQMPGAQNFNYTPVIPDSLTRVRSTGAGVRTASFERDDSTEVETAHVEATRKKNPGFEAIYDRNPATEIRPEVTDDVRSITLDW